MSLAYISLVPCPAKGRVRPARVGSAGAPLPGAGVPRRPRRRRPSRPALRGGEAVPLPRLRPRDTARHRPRGGRAPPRPGAAAALAHVVLAKGGGPAAAGLVSSPGARAFLLEGALDH